jgi:maleylacetate reductase
MMEPFVHQGSASRIVFGVDSVKSIPAEIERLGASRALVLCTPNQRGQAETIAETIASRVAGIFDGAEMHVPIEVARHARQLAASLGADCALAVGGGSTIGLGKAIALDSGLPIIAVPTTYAGSEVTPIFGLTEEGVKKTGRDPRVLPRTVIYDPRLTITLPFSMTVTSAINAIAHAAEGLYAHDGNPVLRLMAEEGIRACAAALAPLAKRPTDLEARSDALYGAWLCGTVLGSAAMGLHHKLCHTLGGSFNLPHAEVHTVILPHALAYNSEAAPDAMRRMETALGKADAPLAVYDLARTNGAPTSLREIGMPADGLDRAADLAASNQYPNPRPLERAALRSLLERAFDGASPRA